MAEVTNDMWKSAHSTETINFLYRNNVTYVVLLWGGLFLRDPRLRALIPLKSAG